MKGDDILSKWDKLIRRIRMLSGDIRFEELAKVLESYGYVDNTPQSGSSHHTFRKKGCRSITVPKHSPIKKEYVKMVRAVVEKEEKNERVS